MEEMLRQKSFLERQSASLRQQMRRQETNHKQLYRRKVKECAFLIEEIGRLKKEAKQGRGWGGGAKRRVSGGSAAGSRGSSIEDDFAEH